MDEKQQEEMVLEVFRRHRERLVAHVANLDNVLADLLVCVDGFLNNYPEVADEVLEERTITIQAPRWEDSKLPTTEQIKSSATYQEVNADFTILNVLPKRGRGITAKTIKERLLAGGVSRVYFKGHRFKSVLNHFIELGKIKQVSGDRYRLV